MTKRDEEKKKEVIKVFNRDIDRRNTREENADNILDYLYDKYKEVPTTNILKKEIETLKNWLFKGVDHQVNLKRFTKAAAYLTWIGFVDYIVDWKYTRGIQ